MRQHDVGGTVTLDVVDSAGQPLDLTGATATAVLRIGPTHVERAAQITGPGRVAFTVGPDDLTHAGVLYLQVRVERAGGQVAHSAVVAEAVEPAL